MGREIDRWEFQAADYAAFTARLQQETATLSHWFQAGRFADAPLTVGYELEACLVDADGRPADANASLLEQLDMPQVVPELSRSNIEFNGGVHVLAGDGLRRMQAEIEAMLQHVRSGAQSLGLDILLIGIPPTLLETQLSLAHISPSNRYRAIDRSLAALRGDPQVHLRIHGHEDYAGDFDSIMPESAATSFQLHLRLPPAQSVSWYNAALVASAPVLAVSANSPWLFGRDLWAETRIPVFAQSVDTGACHYVSFGNRYLHDSLLELFEENLQAYPPLLPIELEGPMAHLQLHNGTIWRWNRPILAAGHADPHLRLEHRSLPSGPSVADMMANAAFFWGLMRSLAEAPLPIEFSTARANFYRAARYGIDAELEWADGQTLAASTLLRESLLPMARVGLEKLDVDSADSQAYLGIIDQRLRGGRSGAGWQRAWVARHGRDLQQLMKAYLAQQWSGNPVAEWEL